MIHKKNSYDGSTIVEYIRKNENVLYTFNIVDEQLNLINETEYTKDNRSNKNNNKIYVLLDDFENILKNNKIKIVKSKKINNIDCYQIKNVKTNDMLFVEKNTGLLLRKESTYQTVDYSFDFNCVNQDIFEEYKRIIEEEE